jgi:hypothetical protein
MYDGSHTASFSILAASPRAAASSLVDDGFEVFDLALDSPWLRVAAVAVAPTVIVEHGEAR